MSERGTESAHPIYHLVTQKEHQSPVEARKSAAKFCGELFVKDYNKMFTHKFTDEHEIDENLMKIVVQDNITNAYMNKGSVEHWTCALLALC